MLAFVLDATMHPICVSKAIMNYIADLQAICNELFKLRPANAACLARMGRVLEGLGPVLSVSRMLAEPIIDTFFSLLQALHALRGTGVSGGSDSAPWAREQRQLSKCYGVLATKAPEVFVPYLNSVAERTLSLVAAQVLGDADKNVVFDGVLISAAAAGIDNFTAVISAMLQPVQAHWSALPERIPSEAALLQRMLSPVQQQQQVTAIGGNDERSFVYYTLQLLTFCARQGKASEGRAAAQVRVTATDKPAHVHNLFEIGVLLRYCQNMQRMIPL